MTWWPTVLYSYLFRPTSDPSFRITKALLPVDFRADLLVDLTLLVLSILEPDVDVSRRRLLMTEWRASGVDNDRVSCCCRPLRAVGLSTWLDLTEVFILLFLVFLIQTWHLTHKVLVLIHHLLRYYYTFDIITRRRLYGVVITLLTGYWLTVYVHPMRIFKSWHSNVCCLEVMGSLNQLHVRACNTL